MGVGIGVVDTGSGGRGICGVSAVDEEDDGPGEGGGGALGVT